jgi:hypothetical protein
MIKPKKVVWWSDSRESSSEAENKEQLSFFGGNKLRKSIEKEQRKAAHSERFLKARKKEEKNGGAHLGQTWREQMVDFSVDFVLLEHHQLQRTPSQVAKFLLARLKDMQLEGRYVNMDFEDEEEHYVEFKVDEEKEREKEWEKMFLGRGEEFAVRRRREVQTEGREVYGRWNPVPMI